MFSPIFSRLVFMAVSLLSTRLILSCRFSDGFIAVSCSFVTLRLLDIVDCVNCVNCVSSVSLIVCFSNGAASLAFMLSALLLVSLLSVIGCRAPRSAC